MSSAMVMQSVPHQLLPRGHTNDLRKPIPQGKRNQSLFHMGLAQAAHADDFETLMDAMRTRNMDCALPLSEAELETAARSAWKYECEGRNLVGRGKAVVLSHDMIDGLDDADAFYLMAVLKRHHWGRDFVLTKASMKAEWDRMILPSMPGCKGYDFIPQ
jgi:hypothetical protein